MTLLTVVGARPQFIKAAVVSPALREAGIDEILVHTGQHYDGEMSAAFFEGLDLPQPKHSLQIDSGSHGAQMGRMMNLTKHTEAAREWGVRMAIPLRR